MLIRFMLARMLLAAVAVLAAWSATAYARDLTIVARGEA